MLLRRLAPAFATLATLVLAAPVMAQTTPPVGTDTGSGVAQPGTMHRTTGQHRTTRHHATQRAGQHHAAMARRGGNRYGNAQNAEVERLNQRSLQQAQAGGQPMDSMPSAMPQ